jgi:hypothetical protein
MELNGCGADGLQTSCLILEAVILGSNIQYIQGKMDYSFRDLTLRRVPELHS